MGIEALGSAVASVASAVGKGAAPAVAGLGKFGPEIKGLSLPLINEGPVAPRFLENTMPLVIGKLNPIKEIRFNEPLTVPSVIAEAESILAQARKPVALPSVIPANAGIQLNTSSSELDPRWSLPHTAIRGGDDKRVRSVIAPQVGPLVMPIYDNNLYDRTPYWHEFNGLRSVLHEPNGHTLVRSSTSTLLNSALSPALEPATKTESKVSAQPTEAVLAQPVPVYEREQEEIVEDQVKKQKPKEWLSEAIETEQRVYLEDERALAQRRHEIKEAIVKAKVEADSLGLERLTGQLVAKFMPAEHAGNRSRVLKERGPDGSYQEIVEAIAGLGEFESEEKAVEKSNEIVAEKKPVKLGKNGTPVGNEDVARVFKYRTVKPVQAHQEVVRRVIKKGSTLSGASLGVNTNPPHSSLSLTAHSSESKTLGWTGAVTEGVKTESSLEDYPVLAEVF